MALHRISGFSTVGSFAAVTEAIPAVTNAVSQVTNFLKGLFGNFVIGDQVPEYPIKSKATLEKILNQFSAAFPDPKNVIEASNLLTKAMQWRDEGIKKGGAVNETYAMIADEIAQKYDEYIQLNTPKPGNTNLPQGMPKPPGETSDMQKYLPYILIGGALLYFMSNKR